MCLNLVIINTTTKLSITSHPKQAFEVLFSDENDKQSYYASNNREYHLKLYGTYADI